jgi:predicted TIM-barrel fold metal-dependent hydrolase
MTCHHAAGSRRDFIAALAALGATAALPAAAGAAGPGRVDVHHHFFPPDYLGPLAQWGEREGFGGLQPPQRDWSVERDLAEMERTGTATAILSISTPGVWFGDVDAARRIARRCNDYAAGMARDHKGRYGLFAAVPMPDVDGTLAEIAHALDTLHADGIGFMTSYGDVWPGDKRFAPVFEELNRRQAVAYFHPLAPDCCGHLIPGVPASMLEYPQDTARAVVSLLFSGAFARYPDIRFVFSHAGASIPVLAGRIANGAKARKDLAEIAPEGIETALQKLYYDTANSAFAPTMAALLAFVPPTQVLFGSDYPYYTIAETIAGVDKLGLTAAQREAIERGNAERLLVSVRQYGASRDRG